MAVSQKASTIARCAFHFFCFFFSSHFCHFNVFVSVVHILYGRLFCIHCTVQCALCLRGYTEAMLMLVWWMTKADGRETIFIRTHHRCLVMKGRHATLSQYEHFNKLLASPGAYLKTNYGIEKIALTRDNTTAREGSAREKQRENIERAPTNVFWMSFEFAFN